MKTLTRINRLIGTYHSKYWRENIDEWIDIATIWLQRNKIDIDKRQIFVRTYKTLCKHPLFANQLEKNYLGYTKYSHKWDERGICIISDSFSKEHRSKQSLMKLISRKRQIKLSTSDCYHIVFILFHEIGHWVIDSFIFDINGKEITKNINKIEKLFNADTEICQSGNCFEHAADWFALYALNYELVREINVDVYSFFRKKLKIDHLFENND